MVAGAGAAGTAEKAVRDGRAMIGIEVGRDPTTHGVLVRIIADAGAYGGFVASSQTESGAATGGAPSGSVTLMFAPGTDPKAIAPAIEKLL